MSVPASLRFPQLLPTAVEAVSTRFSNVPVSGTEFATDGATITSIDIQGSSQRACWLDPAGTVLRFTYNCTLSGGTTPTWALLAHNAISAISLYSSAGAAQIESITEYNLLHDVLRSMTSSSPKHVTVDTILMGADPTRMREAYCNAAAVTSVDFAIPLVSIISALSAGDGRYLPLFALDSPLRLDITWAAGPQAVALTGAPTTADTKITNVRLDTTTVTLADSAQKQIEALTGGVYTWTSSVWKTYRTSHPANQLSNSIMIPSRVDSAKSLFIAQRLAASEYDHTKASVQGRCRNNLANYRCRIANDWVTPTPVDCTGQALPAFLNAMNVLSNPMSEAVPTLLGAASYAIDTEPTWASNVVSPAFLVGVELESFSNNAKLISGKSTASNSLVVDLVYSSAPAAANITSMLECDATFEISNGQLRVAF